MGLWVTPRRGILIPIPHPPLTVVLQSTWGLITRLTPSDDERPNSLVIVLKKAKSAARFQMKKEVTYFSRHAPMCTLVYLLQVCLKQNNVNQNPSGGAVLQERPQPGLEVSVISTFLSCHQTQLNLKIWLRQANKTCTNEIRIFSDSRRLKVTLGTARQELTPKASFCGLSVSG